MALVEYLHLCKNLDLSMCDWLGNYSNGRTVVLSAMMRVLG